ncbi:DNA polymerase III subunit delta' [Ectobacillus ponti]|uniref:DNA polymerase III subunit delta' n=1 Tax=Ectobacillus ponti TaxID=2961894 RepID=A0AA42BSB2_9BACI|nr:DNA polymerase III subunit delta' [Ectobacillus ponti]MCP8971201.1 DNA polymerase III subunit delta' [Ectobacillus ponti]
MIQTWEQLVQMQPIAVKMLTNSIRKERISHAYLLEGPKGTGKAAVAVQLAKSMLCTSRAGIEPCQHCSNCRRIDSGNHPNVYMVKPDGLSIKKQQIQELQGEFSKTGVEASSKIYIIEHADRMTTTAANTLLKFLEEPGGQTTAVLLTEHSHQMLNTILSRCQTLTFRPLPKDALVQQLQGEGAGLHMAALAAQLTNNLEQALAYCHEEWFAQARDLVIKLYEALGKDKSALFFVQEKWVKHFAEKEQMQLGLDMLLILYKDVLYAQLEENQNIVFQDQLPILQSLSYSQRQILSVLSNILEAKNRIQANANVTLTFEQLVLRLQEG